MDMDTSKDSWNACLQYRNKQLTKQLKDYQKVSALTKCSSSLIVAMGQLLCLHQKPSYGIIKDEAEWRDLFIVIDLFYGTTGPIKSSGVPQRAAGVLATMKLSNG